MTGAGLDGIESLGAGPVLVLKESGKNPGEGGRFMGERRLECLGGAPGFEGGESAQDDRRKSPIHVDHQRPLDDDGQREDGEDHQDGHEEATLDKELEESCGEEHVNHNGLVSSKW